MPRQLVILLLDVISFSRHSKLPPPVQTRSWQKRDLPAKLIATCSRPTPLPIFSLELDPREDAYYCLSCYCGRACMSKPLEMDKSMRAGSSFSSGLTGDQFNNITTP